MHSKITYVAVGILLFSTLLPSPATAGRRSQHPRTNLRVGYYDRSCPQAEEIVREVVEKATSEDRSIGASLIRLYFHDCFVQGCDASILLDATPSGEPVEKTSPGNLGVRGFELIDEAKARLEEQCPNTVSCADIISFATRDAVVAEGLASYDVPGGRRDGLSSIAANVLNNLPSPNANVDEMDQIFEKKGMNKGDLVALLGAHSIGVAHCVVVEDQLYNATNEFQLNSLYAMHMRSLCPLSKVGTESVDNLLMPLNPIMGNMLSNMYYRNVIHGRAIMPADRALLQDPTTSELVQSYAWRSVQWADDFLDSMVKLGKVDVLTGKQGEIRKSCRAVNH